MRQRLVERVEVVPDRLDLGAVDDLVAQPEEDVLDLADDLRQRMEAPAAEPRARQRDVERLVEARELGAPELVLPCGDRGFDALARRIEGLAGVAVADAA